MKRILLLFSALMLSCIALWAHDVEIGGIYYDLNDKTATVTYRGSSPSYYDNEYSGSVTIPETITHNFETYSVTSISSYAFSGCSGLTSVTIPNSVTSIGSSAFYNTGLYDDESNWDNGVLYIDNCLIKANSDVVKGSYTIKEGTRIIGGSAFYDCSGLTEVSICESVTSIGSSAFYDCSELTSVTIPNSVTSIGQSAFSGCSGLTSVTIPNSVTSIGYDVFSGCSGLTSVTIPNSVTSIGGIAFRGCSGLTSVTIPNSVTSIGSSAFYNTGIYEDESNWDNGVLYIDNCLIEANWDVVKGSYTIKKGTRLIGSSTFYGCSELTSVTIPNSVTSIGNEAFYGCSGLTKVTIGNSVTSIGKYAFYDCSGLTSVIWNAKNCEDFSSYTYSPFDDIRSSITSFTFGNEVEHIPAYLCSYMNNLKEVTIGKSVTSIGSYAFNYCSGLTKVNYLGTVDKWLEIDFDDYVSNPTYYAKDLYINNELLTDVKITIVDSIKNYAFYNCRSIKSVEISNSVTSIGYRAFYGCSGLTKVTIGNSVTSIGKYAFYDCSGLTSVIWNAKNYKDFEDYDETPFYKIRSSITSFTFGNEVEHIPAYLCYDIKNLKEVTIGESVTSIGNYAFYGCSGLTEVTIPNSVTSIGEDAFYGCSGLTKVDYLGTVDKWVEFDFNYSSHNPTYYAKDLYINNELLTDVKITKADSIKKYAFYNCQSIKSVEIGESVTSIGDKAFYNCSGLTSVTIGESVTSIGSDAFENCSELTSVTIPNSITTIGSSAFKYCSGLTSVTIGESVTSIGSDAFYGCDKLRKVTAYPTTVPSVYKNSFAHYNAALYVPCDVYDDYFFDEVWGTFKVTDCIAAEEVDAPDKVEIEVDEDNNANVIWPSTDGAKKYELEISKDGEVFCTLLFNENGQLTSIDFGNRSASVGFQFTVTGLDGASKYAYSMVAMDKKGNELQSYKGTFTTNGYVPGPGEEDEPVSITETLADANITITNGLISVADADFSIYNTIGLDVTAFNGSLQPGVYLVSIENNIVKVMVK